MATELDEEAKSAWSLRRDGMSGPGAAADRNPGRTLAPRTLLPPPPFPALLACYLAYMLAAGFGQWMMVVPGVSITIWPPNGVILAVLLAHPPRSWPWWIAVAAAGELSANLIWFGNPALPALGYIAANAAEVLVAAAALTLLGGPRPHLHALPQVLAFLAIGALAAPAVGATLGAAVDALAGKNPFLATWPLWWLGDATGVLIATPLILALIEAWTARAAPKPRQAVEAGALVLLLAALGLWQLSGDLRFAFLLLVPVLGMALRFQLGGAVLAALALALVIGLDAHLVGTPERSAAEAGTRHATLQAFTIVAASLGLIVAAIVRQHRESERDLIAANTSLEARVSERTRAIEAAERRFKATFENAAVGIAILDPQSVFLRVNDSLARMLGYEPGALEGRLLDDLTHPDDLSAGRQAWAQLRDGATDSYDLEKRYACADGDWVWGHTSVSCVRRADGSIDYLIKIIQDVTARRRADEARQLLMHEVNHRTKNLFSIIRAIARQTASKSPKEFVETFGQRLQALAANQDMLIQNAWNRVSLGRLVRLQLGHFGDALETRIRLKGPEVSVSASAAQALGLALHELGTNAAKYGSLRTSGGRVEVAWSVEGDAFRMTWTEIGGPAVAEPGRRGFGSTVTRENLAAVLGGTVDVDFAPGGLSWRLDCSLAALRDEPATA